MDFPSQLETLEKKASETVAAVRAAAAEDRTQLKQRIDEAQVQVNLALKDAQDKAEDVAGQAQSKWAQLKADAAAKVDDMKARADERAAQRDADAAEAEAEWAEANALDTIDYAEWAIDNARLAALDALDARVQADELAASAGT